MAQPLKNYAVRDFSGGLVTNASDFDMKDNEVKNLVNFDIDNRGRLVRRRGIQQLGDTTSERILHSDSQTLNVVGGADNLRNYHYVFTRGASNSVGIFRVWSTYLTTAITTASTTANVGSTVGFNAATSFIEIDGDIIEYTAIPSGTAFTITASTIARGHAIGAQVNQLTEITGSPTTDLDPTDYVYTSLLRGSTLPYIFICTRAGTATFDTSNGLVALVDTDADGGLYATNYRSRIYQAGAGGAQKIPTRVFYSNAGDPLTWDVNDIFDVEDDKGEIITGLRVLQDVLGIFKLNSIFTYNEIELKQRVKGVGAYNQQVIQQIGNVYFTFCPTGVWATNFYSATKVSEPIEPYLRGFNPIHTSGGGVARSPINTFAMTYDNKYFLYIGDITEPETRSDVVLVYDTIRKNWTVYDGFTDFTHLESFTTAYGSNPLVASGVFLTQKREMAFGGDSGGKYFRLFDTRYVDGEATQTNRGADLPNDILAQTPTAIQAICETKFYDLRAPFWWKSMGYVRALIERGNFQISYRLDLGDRYTDWISLGEFNFSNQRKAICDKDGQNYQGLRIAFRITTAQPDVIPIFNGFIIEGSQAVREYYG